jgi:hypothetical protein
MRGATLPIVRIQRAGVILVVAALLVAACDAAAPSGASTDRPAATSLVPSAAPSGSARASTIGSSAPATSSPAGPGPSGSAAASGSPKASPAASVGPVPGGSIDPSLCAGSDANRQFFRDVAAQVAWAVYCPTLPKAWFVEAGSFRAASGGSMVISYKTSSGQRIELKEGVGCLGVPIECGPYDTSLGTASYGDLTGQLGKLGSGYVLYVKPGLSPSWSATATGLDEVTFRSICSTLLKVAK